MIQRTCLLLLAVWPASLLANPDGVFMNRPTQVEDGDQTFVVSESFPKTWIEQVWEQGYSISNVWFFGRKWVVLADKRIRWGRQQYFLRNQVPTATIRQYIEDGYSVTAVAVAPDPGFGAAAVLVLLSRQPGWGPNDIRYHAGFWQLRDGPDEQGRIHVRSAYVGGTHSLPGSSANYLGIYAKVPGIEAQRSAERDDMPIPYLESGWADGYRVQSLTYTGVRWNISMVKPTQSIREYHFDFSEVKIRERMREGYRISTFYGDIQ